MQPSGQKGSDGAGKDGQFILKISNMNYCVKLRLFLVSSPKHLRTRVASYSCALFFWTWKTTPTPVATCVALVNIAWLYTGSSTSTTRKQYCPSSSSLCLLAAIMISCILCIPNFYHVCQVQNYCVVYHCDNILMVGFRFYQVSDNNRTPMVSQSICVSSATCTSS